MGIFFFFTTITEFSYDKYGISFFIHLACFRIFSVLSAVLHIGNINFRKAGEQDYVTIKNIATVKVVSDLLKVRTETLMLALTKRKSVARGEQFFVQYRMAEVGLV